MGASRRLFGLLTIGLATVSMSTVALAARGGNGGGNSDKQAVAIVVGDGVYGGTTDAMVTLAGDPTVLASSVSGAEYRTLAQCWQNDALVMKDYSVTVGGVVTVQLGPTMNWTGGAAYCEISIGDFGNNGRWRSTATTAFAAYPG